MSRLVEGGITGDELEIGKSYYLMNSDGLKIDLGELKVRDKSTDPYLGVSSVHNNVFIFSNVPDGMNEFGKKYKNTFFPATETWHNSKIFYPSPSGGKRKRKRKRLMSKKVKKNRRKLTRRIKFE